MSRLNGLILLDHDAFEAVYAPDAAAAIAERVRLPQGRLMIEANQLDPHSLEDIDVIFSGWGCPRMDEAFLAAAPRLKAVFYAAGAISGWATPALFERGIVVTTANTANAIPVAEYTVATTLFSLKHGWKLSCRNRSKVHGFKIRPDTPGAYRSVVGLVGLGTVARLVVNLLASYDVRVIAYDPFLTAEDALRLGVQNVGLDELFAESDVVSLHAPDLATTRHMIDGRLVGSMKRGATLINTARGRVVNEPDLIRVLRERQDLHAVLDVTQQEPLPESSPLHTMNNVTLTPHIAGSQGRECRRMGQYMVDELDRFLAGRPLLYQVKASDTAHSVHHVVG